MKTLYEKSNKTFLTPASGQNSAIVWDVTVDEFERLRCDEELEGGDEEDNVSWISVDSTLYIMDCYKRVALEFSLWGSRDSAREAERKLEKLDLLISELSAFRDHLAVGYDKKLTLDKEVKE